MSAQQTQLLKKIRDVLGKDISIKENYRPDVLKNTLTGKNLEIDLYLDQFNIGFEYQGAVHFTYIGRYKNDPDKIREYDMLKNDLTIKNHSLAIVEIFEDDLSGDFLPKLLTRMENTIYFYFKMGRITQTYRLEKLRSIIQRDNGQKADFYSSFHIRILSEIIVSNRNVKDRVGSFLNKNFEARPRGYLIDRIYKEMVLNV